MVWFEGGQSGATGGHGQEGVDTLLGHLEAKKGTFGHLEGCDRPNEPVSDITAVMVMQPGKGFVNLSMNC